MGYVCCIMLLMWLVWLVAGPIPACLAAEEKPGDTLPSAMKMVIDPGKASGMTIFFTPEKRTGQAPVPDMMESGSEFGPEPDGARAGTADAMTGPSFTLTAGYRNDYFDFTIPGQDNDPNIISELEWEDMHSLEIQGILRWTAPSNFCVRAGASAAFTVKGENRDSDWAEDNKTLEWSRTYADSDGSTLFDASLGLGYRFQLLPGEKGRQIFLVPLAGYAYHVQHLAMRNGIRAVSQAVPQWGYESRELGPFSGLNSQYEAVWQGPWIGFETLVSVSPRFGFETGVEYHWADYDATANWNLRQDLAHPLSFDQEATGEGYRAWLCFWFRPWRDWEWLAGISWQRMETGAGSRRHYWADGTSTSYGFHGALWRSWSVNLGLRYYF